MVGVLEYTYSTRPGSRRHYLVEEFIEGDDLSTWLAAAPHELADVGDLFRGVFDGLHALGREAIVHRDLKPANIRVRPDGTPVIIDFGLVRALRQPDLTRTVDGAMIGTPSYFAPEQFTGSKREIDHRTDLFACGIIMYHALVGRHPFYESGMSLADLQHRVCSDDQHLAVQEFVDLPRPWRLLASRLLSRDRARRPADAGQVRDLLTRLLEEPADA